jgi:Lon protease-like protein
MVDMPESLLPLFPLEVVLLPGTPMRLYKEMIAESIRDKTEFGIVQAGDGGILNIGCTATVEQVVYRYPDGRMDIIVTGRRRFEIILLDDGKPYLRASVAFFDDEDEESATNELRAMVIAGLTALRAAEDKDQPELPDSRESRLSFRVAWYVPELPLRQTLLALRSESARLRQLAEFLPEYVARVRRTTHVRKVAPLNGHGFMTIGVQDGEDSGA